MVAIIVMSVILAVFAVIRYRPVRGLNMLDLDQLCEMKNRDEVQLLDVRDPVDYESAHMDHAMNIYVGRLAFISLNELPTDKGIVVVSTSVLQIHRAARILKRRGYVRVFGYIWNPEDHEQRTYSDKKQCA